MRDPRKHIDLLEGRHKGQRMLICGLGPSIELLPVGHGILTIGVNDIGRYFDPDYLLILDQPDVFRPRQHRREGSLEFILNTRPRIATCVHQNMAEAWEPLLQGHKMVLRMQTEGIPSRPDVPMPPWKDHVCQLHSGGGGSPLTAASLAGFLGASDVGVIGVDLADHPKLIETRRLQMWNYCWDRLSLFFEEKKIALWNLSPDSALTKHVRRMDLHGWIAGEAQGHPPGANGARDRERAERASAP